MLVIIVNWKVLQNANNTRAMKAYDATGTITTAHHPNSFYKCLNVNYFEDNDWGQLMMIGMMVLLPNGSH